MSSKTIEITALVLPCLAATTSESVKCRESAMDECAKPLLDYLLTVEKEVCFFEIEAQTWVVLFLENAM